MTPLSRSANPNGPTNEHRSQALTSITTTIPDDYIIGILRSVKTIAMVGASSNPARPSFLVLKYLLAKGYRVIPVNPGQAGKEILGQTGLSQALSDIPEPIDMVDIFRASDAAPGIVDAGSKLDPLPKVVWMQLTVRNDEAAAKAEAAGIRVVMNRCPKIEYGRLSGEIGWNGVNSRIISSKKPVMRTGFQSFGIRDVTRREIGVRHRDCWSPDIRYSRKRRNFVPSVQTAHGAKRALLLHSALQ